MFLCEGSPLGVRPFRRWPFWIFEHKKGEKSRFCVLCFFCLCFLGRSRRGNPPPPPKKKIDKRYKWMFDTEIFPPTQLHTSITFSAPGGRAPGPISPRFYRVFFPIYFFQDWVFISLAPRHAMSNVNSYSLLLVKSVKINENEPPPP